MASASAPTKSGLLSDVARHVVLPSGVVSTGWPGVRDTCKGFGVGFDPWQDGAGRAILAKRADGIYASTVGGVVISIPRQVGKTYLIGAIVFALCLLFPGLTVIWTAHRLRTAAETFASMQAFARRKRVAPHVKNIVRGSGDEAIEFHNGSRILFGARERGFGRGFAQVGVLVFDEAQILTENAIDDMVPATNQADNPLLFFIGTPPKPTDPGEVFTRKRREVLAGESDDTVFIEFSADRGCDPMDRKQWAKANPSFPRRTNEAAMLRMRKNLSEDSFVREALGVWDDEGGVFPPGTWAVARDPHSSLEKGRAAFGFDLAPDAGSASIGFAGIRPDGKWHGELVEDGNLPGTAWVLPRLVRAVKAAGPRCAAIGTTSNGAALVPELKQLLAAEGIEVDVFVVTGGQYGQACEALYGYVTQGEFVHRGQDSLNTAAAGARQREQGDVKVWDRKRWAVDITPLCAVTVALRAFQTAPEPEAYAGGFTDLDDYLEE